MNDALKIENNDIMNKFQKTENILNDVQNIIEVSQKEAYRAVNTILSQRNWLIGYRIAEEELAGEDRAEYGVEIIKKLSNFLGLIIELYYRCLIRQRVIGMKKKHMSKPGVCVLYSGI